MKLFVWELYEIIDGDDILRRFIISKGLDLTSAISAVIMRVQEEHKDSQGQISCTIRDMLVRLRTRLFTTTPKVYDPITFVGIDVQARACAEDNSEYLELDFYFQGETT